MPCERGPAGAQAGIAASHPSAPQRSIQAVSRVFRRARRWRARCHLTHSLVPEPDPVAVREVLRYFVRHPHAVDDLEGIARWRIAEEVIRRKVEETHRALAWLVDRDYLRLTQAPGVAPLFSLNPDKAAEATALAESEAPARPEDTELHD